MPRERSRLIENSREFEDKLRDIKRRWYYLMAMEAELKRVSRGKPFRIFNTIEWQMALDSYDVLVLEFASWVQRQSEAGGLFGLMKSRLNELPRKLPKGRREKGDDEFLFGYDTAAHENAIVTLFPESSGRIVQSSDVDALKLRLQNDCQQLVDDRNANRAHKHERPQSVAPRVGLSDLGALFDTVEKVLNLVRLIADFSTTSYHDMNQTDVESAAKDFVDSVFIGTSQQQRFDMQDTKDWLESGPTLERDEYYARLHAMHDANEKATEQKLWNEFLLRDR